VRELAQLVSARHAVISEVHCCTTQRPQSRMPESTPGMEMMPEELLLLLDAVPDEELDVAPELLPPLDAVPELAPDEDAVPEDPPDDVPDEEAPTTTVPPSGRTSISV
jgi:hypothetical protein